MFFFQIILLALSLAQTIRAHGFMISPSGLKNKEAIGAVRGFGQDNPDTLEGPGNPTILCHNLPKSRVVPVSIARNGRTHTIGLSISARHPGPCSVEIIDPTSGKIVEIGASNNCARSGQGAEFDWSFMIKNMEQVQCTSCILRWVWTSSDLIPTEHYQSCSDITLTNADGNGPAPPQPPVPQPQPPPPQPTAAPKPKPTEVPKPNPTVMPQPPPPQPLPPAPQPQLPATSAGKNKSAADCMAANEFLCVKQCGKVLIHCTGAGTGVLTEALDEDVAVCNNGRIDFKANCVV
ncbi:hypothetical protein BC830DRAFT_1082570 [Chytriomyces sp. MP71]|nr:hypothetical protein BC830DRAFT_1082570 [Chytriomyces sp. MP71]